MQNTNAAPRENVVKRHLPEKLGGWEWSGEASASSSPGGAAAASKLKVFV